jgi:hypothetical protein
MRLRKLLSDAVQLCSILLEDLIEDAVTNSRAELQNRLRETAERGAELALEKARLEDEVDKLRFNGPTLYRDEVDLLEEYARIIETSLAYGGVAESFEDRQADVKILRNLLGRCDHMPNTAEEFGKMVNDALANHTAVDWDDVGKDVDDDPYEGSWREAADNEGAKIAAEIDKGGGDDDIPF